MPDQFGFRLNNLQPSIELPNNWKLYFGGTGEDSYLQVQCKGTCNVTKNPMDWNGRKWRLSRYMTDGEIVQTALMACLAASEHEIREQFRYKGGFYFRSSL